MRRFISVLLLLSVLLSISGCRKKSDIPCSECKNEDAYLYEIEKIGKKTLDEKITVSYCESCYNAYLEETFGYGLKAKAEIEDANFKDIIGSGGYIQDLKR